jgi:hypothetical protein
MVIDVVAEVVDLFSMGVFIPPFILKVGGVTKKITESVTT